MATEQWAAKHDKDGQTSQRPGYGKAVALALKLVVTATCLWYAARTVNLADLVMLGRTLDLYWLAAAIVLIAGTVPLAGYRWSFIVQTLKPEAGRVPRATMMAITSIGVFFMQVSVNLVGDIIRVWMLTRIGYNWRVGMTSVLLDRGIGLVSLLALGTIFLSFSTALSALGGYGAIVRSTFMALIAVAVFGLILAPYFAAVFNRFAMTRWIATLILGGHRVFLRSPAGIAVAGLALTIHALTIMAVWSLGLAQGLALTGLDAAVLFTVMIAIAAVPISIAGWGLRELALISLLQSYGLTPERALFFSVSFGLVIVAASLPGAIVWALFSSPRQPFEQN